MPSRLKIITNSIKWEGLYSGKTGIEMNWITNSFFLYLLFQKNITDWLIERKIGKGEKCKTYFKGNHLRLRRRIHKIYHFIFSGSLRKKKLDFEYRLKISYLLPHYTTLYYQSHNRSLSSTDTLAKKNYQT